MSENEYPAPEHVIAGAPDLGVDIDDDWRVTLRQIPDGYDEWEAVTVAPTSLPELARVLRRLHREWRQKQGQDRQAGKD